MAAFQIHEDIQNLEAVNRKILTKKHVLKENENIEKIESKKYLPHDKNESNVVLKKTFLDNRETSKVVLNSVKVYSEGGDKQCEEKNVQENKVNRTSIEEPFLEIEKENRIVSVSEDEKEESFPLELLHNIEYKREIWNYLRELEERIPLPKPSYMKKQSDISWESRSILIDWLASVCEEFHFCDESFHLGVNYIDRFLSQISVARNKFQLVGAAAMMVATKMEEYYPIDAAEWSGLTGDTFTSRQVLKMEQVILKVLRFQMQTPTINGFIQQLATEQKMDEKTLHLAMYISELVLLEGDNYLEFVPSKLASACIVLARYTLWKRVIWPKRLERASGYTIQELDAVVKKQSKTLRDSPLKQQQAIRTKYQSERFNKVALTKPRRILLTDFINE